MPLPFPSFSLNPFTDRNNPTTAATDDLAAVKAAAWAWYQHGSGSEPKPMREFGLTRPITLPKPSRYRLEAIRIAQTRTPTPTLFQDNPQTPNPPNSLLDSYEIQSISRRLTDLLDPTDPNNFSFRSFGSQILDPQHQLSSPVRGGDLEMKKTTKPNKFRGFWWRSSVMCGKTDDVVVGSFVRPSEKQPRRPMRRRTTPAHGQPLPSDL